MMPLGEQPTPEVGPTPPQFVVLGGPNGAGKSTWSTTLIPSVIRYINADDIARTLTMEPGRNRDIEAGRLLLEEWDRLAAEQADFGVETTLSSRSLAARISRLQGSGYVFRLVCFWLPNADLAVTRVADRVRMGGHGIPEVVVRRRYAAGLRNFFELYIPLADTWQVVQNVEGPHILYIAAGVRGHAADIVEPAVWERMKEQANE